MADKRIGRGAALAVSLTFLFFGSAGCSASEKTDDSAGLHDTAVTAGSGPEGAAETAARLSFPLEFETIDMGSDAFPTERGAYWESPYWFSEEDLPLVVPLQNGTGGQEVDEHGVVIVDWPGQEEPVYHPVSMAMYGLYALEGYDISGESEYLRRAEANAQALVDGAEDVDGALWFPYAFDHVLNSDESMKLEAPWYSGMAQGQALDLFSRLCAVTERQYWCDQADKTFKSFLETDLPGQSFARVDDEGYLWLEEYVGTAPFTEVINGHAYSAFGLAEYARQTGNEAAAEMVSGAAATMIHYFENYRLPGGISYYCNADYCKDSAWQPENYHRGVGRQFRILGYLTDVPEFRQMHDLFADDYDEWVQENQG